jgi:pimeloyl-ACP methyl ester carboxylesterase
MVADVRWAVDALSQNEQIDPSQIYVAGYSLGGAVGLYSAALDERIAGVISVSGFTPMRGNIKKNGGEGIYEYSHLHGLLPRLGFFIGEEKRLPYDFQEIMAAIAPRPLMIITPRWDQYATFTETQNSLTEVQKVYDLYHERDNLEVFTPEDYNRFSDEMKQRAVEWLQHVRK